MRLAIFFIFCTVTLTANAQSWEIGGFVGGSGYIGDINPVKVYKLTDLAFGGQAKRNFDGNWSLKASLMHGKIRGNDAKSSNSYQQQRNLSFYSPITEGSFQVEFNFFNYQGGVGKRIFSPFLFAGVGAVAFNPKTTYNGEEYELVRYNTEGQGVSNAYRTYALAIPYGAGIKYNVTGNFNLIGEIGYRTAYTDYLDDISGNYPNKASLNNAISIALSDRSGEVNGNYVGAAGTQRGDYRKKDTYMFMGISLTYTFVSSKCPTF